MMSGSTVLNVCFSKNRPFQLREYLRTFLQYGCCGGTSVTPVTPPSKEHQKELLRQNNEKVLELDNKITEDVSVSVVVIYACDDRFLDAYLELERMFDSVTFLREGRDRMDHRTERRTRRSDPKDSTEKKNDNLNHCNNESSGDNDKKSAVANDGLHSTADAKANAANANDFTFYGHMQHIISLLLLDRNSERFANSYVMFGKYTHEQTSPT